MPLVKTLKIREKKKSFAIAKDRLVEKRASYRKTWANEHIIRLRKPASWTGKFRELETLREGFFFFSLASCVDYFQVW